MKNQKGFTLIELLAVMILSTTVLVPLLSGLIGNYQVNQRMHARKAASSISLTTIDAFDKIYFQNLTDYLGDETIVEITKDSCSEFTADIDEEEDSEVELRSDELCTMIFEQEWNNIQFTDTDAFKVYIYPYYLDQNAIDSIAEDDSIPESIKREVETLEPSNETDPSILRVSVRIVYDEETEQSITSSGVVTLE